MKNRILKFVIWTVFILFYLASGAVVSVAPYMWGERDGSGVFVWFLTIIPFLFLLLFVLLCAIFVNVIKKTVIPSIIFCVGSAVVFLVNFLYPHHSFADLSELNTPIWMWILYVCLPFVYGGISYYLFKYLSSKSDDKLKLKGDGREIEDNVGEC
ncbi:MAG: hypothetical protein VZQ98_06100 [Bacteroidales bacterium]|nr:hypothetical protein [Bacteroidales bacterium]